ncbi:MAG: hypothetical protein K2P88_00870 [Chitinophagaceae bacterium]|uniref:hypothetical protein n=1 Tax=unclassified Paraflavitalea TaxID=2798305 RepID=UPI003D32AC13|nr:hypothetical protein [Chitinophagaceae bacterium]
MPNRSTDPLFLLIKSLEKAEKRNFKLYIKRHSGGEDLKMVQLFDALDKMEEYDEEILLSKHTAIRKQQLSNLKAHLYRQLLTSLRLIKNDTNIDLQLHEQMDFARILYNKGLYLQSLKVLDKLKEMAKEHSQFTYLQQAIFFEKKIETLFITRSMQDRALQLSKESEEVSQKVTLISQLSNLALELYSWYILNGHARNEKDVAIVNAFFEKHFPDKARQVSGFYEQLYLYQSYCWLAFIKQDFKQYYRHTQKWVDLFQQYPDMIDIETGHYIKGMHNLLGAHFDLQNYAKFNEVLQQFEAFEESKTVQCNDNNRMLLFVYLSLARINKHFNEGTFSEGIQLVPQIEEQLTEYELYLDRHRILVFYYKFASLYFGSGDYGTTIDYLNKIINWKMDLRTDLQCYSRLLHLIAHYELGNFELLEFLFKSVYRFMAKMDSLSIVEEEIFKFLRRSFSLSPRSLQPEFQKLLEKLKKQERNQFETRAFVYLDIISWLESKINGEPVQGVIRRKYLEKVGE